MRAEGCDDSSDLRWSTILIFYLGEKAYGNIREGKRCVGRQDEERRRKQK